jgi:SAM-dependent methyltransferase
MSEGIHALAAPSCLLCGGEGRPLYRNLRDRLFSAPGTWSLSQCPNPGCALIWLDPMPAPEDAHKAYSSYYTHEAERARPGAVQALFGAVKRGYVASRFGYSASAGEKMLGLLARLYPGRATELDFSVMWLEAGARGRVLDVGAGSGWLVAHLSSLGWQAQGIDFDANAVKAARDKGLDVRLGGLAGQQFPDASFDAVTMSHSLEHVHEPIALLAEARRILRPGGRLAIATPNSRSLLHRRFREHWFALDPPRHLQLFNRDALAAALRKARFERMRIFTTVRDANGALAGSTSIEKTGRYDMTAPRPIGSRIAGRAFQLLEGAKLRFDPDAGEDLVALAER